VATGWRGLSDQSAAQIKSSPLWWMGGVFTCGQHLGVDARSGHMICTIPVRRKRTHRARGVAMYKGISTSPRRLPSHSLNAKDGTVRWTKCSPMRVRVLVDDGALVGQSCCGGVGGIGQHSGCCARLKREREAQWKWDSTPPTGTRTRPPAHDLDYRNVRSGAEPDLLGTGNPTPVLNGTTRPETTLTRAALSPSTRRRQAGLGFVVSPHDTHDWMRWRFRCGGCGFPWTAERC